MRKGWETPPGLRPGLSSSSCLLLKAFRRRHVLACRGDIGLALPFFSAPAAPQGLVKKTPEITVSVWGQASNVALAVVILV